MDSRVWLRISPAHNKARHRAAAITLEILRCTQHPIGEAAYHRFPTVHLAVTRDRLVSTFELDVLFPLKDPGHCERVCIEILSSYLADTRKARILGADGKYSRPRSVRNGHGFSAQEHLMRLATGSLDHHGKSAPNGPGVVYTHKEVAAEVTSPEADTTAQDSSNAAV